MNSRLFLGRWILLGAIAATALPAPAELTSDQTSQIAAAVDRVMAEGDAAPLKSVLASGDAVAAAGVATRRIASFARRDRMERAKIATADVITLLLGTAPEQSQAILDAALINLPSPLQKAAIAAAQAALSPADGAKILVNRTSCIARNKGLPCRTWRVPLNH